MNLTDSDTLKFMRGSPVFLDDICAVYPAKLGEIVDLGYDKFQQYLGILTSGKPAPKKGGDKEFNKILEQLSDFQYLLLICTMDKEMSNLVRGAFQFFTHESNIIFSLDPAQIVIGPLEEKHIIVEDNYADLQHLLKRMYFIEQEGEDIQINKNDSDAIVRLKKKMIENREKVQRAKAKKAAREKSSMQFSDLIASMTLNNCNLNMANIWDITYYAFHDQLKRMGWRDQFDINNRAALAGAKIKKDQLKHWMRSITDSKQIMIYYGGKYYGS